MTRIVFFGTDEFAIHIFTELLHAPGIEVIALVTKPATPKGRGMQLQQPGIVAHAPVGLPIIQPQKLDDTFTQTIRVLQPDLSIVVAYGKIIPDAILNIPRLKTWNVHPSLLPKYRGPSPIVSAILNGDATTGTSIMQLDSDMDHGPVFAQAIIPIEPNETSSTLRDRIARISAPLLVRTIHDAVNQGLQPIEQKHSQATYTKKFEVTNYKINFSQSTKRVSQHIRAFPGEAWFLLANGKRCKVLKANVRTDVVGSSGKMHCTKEVCVVFCADGSIQLDEVLVEGKKKMDGRSFAQGYRE